MKTCGCAAYSFIKMVPGLGWMELQDGSGGAQVRSSQSPGSGDTAPGKAEALGMGTWS